MPRPPLLGKAPTAAPHCPASPADEPVTPDALAQLPALATTLRRSDRAFTSPRLAARQTAAALGLDAVETAALGDLDHGRWSGHGLAEIATSEPQALETFMRDDGAAPHGGESRAALRTRVADWLDGARDARGHTIAVTHAAVIRVAVLLVLKAPADAFWRLDVAPGSLADLRFDGRRWALRSLGVALSPAA